MKICTMLCATLLMQSFICAMGDQKTICADHDSPLIEFPQKSITINSLRQNIESKLMGARSDLTVGSVLRSLNAHTDKRTVHWNSVVKDLKNDSQISFYVRPMTTKLLTGVMALVAGLGIYQFIQDAQTSTSLSEMKSLDVCLMPLFLNEVLSVPACFTLLGMLLQSSGPHKKYARCLSRSSQFKTMIESFNEETISPEQLLKALQLYNFSELELQSLEHAKNSALLSNGTIHTRAFASSVQNVYPLSDALVSAVVAGGVFSALHSLCLITPNFEVVPQLFNLITLAALVMLSCDSYTKNPDSQLLKGVIKDIEDGQELHV